MKTLKIANLLGNSDNESLKFAIRNGMFLTIKMIQAMAMEMKMVQPLNLKLK